MSTAIGQMHPLELLDDLDEPTQPCTPSGVRLRQMHTEEGALIRIGQIVVSALGRRKSPLARIQHDRLKCLVATVESWSLCEANADVRDNVIREFESTLDAIVNQAFGNR